MIKNIKDNNLFVKGFVVDTNDPKSQSRIKVRIPCYHGSSKDKNCLEDEKLPWAQTCLQNSNVFNVGDIVWITFEGGDTRYPIIFGQLGSTSTFSANNSNITSNGLGIVGGEYDITIDGTVYHVGGSTLAEMGVSIITINEGGDYNAYNGHDVNGPSAGLMGFHASALFNVLKKIRDKNNSNFDSIANSNGASSLITYVRDGDNSFLGGSSSNNVNIPSSSSIGKAIIEIITSDVGKEVQLSEASILVQNYIDLGISSGVNDNAALLFLSDISNQGPYMDICNSMRNSSDKSLDNFFNMSVDVEISGYSMVNRRTLTYKIIKELQNLGALNGTGGILELPLNGDASSFVEILDDTMKEYVFKYNSNGWDYLQDTTRDYYSIRGKSIKTRTDCSGYISAALMVLCQETGNGYAKEVNNWNSSDFMNSNITGFDKIPYKFSDLKAGDIVVRQDHVQAIATEYPDVTIYNCGSIGFGDKEYPENWSEGESDDKYSYIFRIKESYNNWRWVVPSCKNISSPYGNRNDPLDTGSKEFHKGIDISDSTIKGSSIVAAKDGVVVAASENGRYTKNGVYVTGGTGYGNCTIIDHGDGYVTLYAHQNTINVVVGQEVKAGQIIGTVGNTGNSTGPHLHFEVRSDNGTHYNPLNFVSNK